MKVKNNIFNTDELFNSIMDQEEKMELEVPVELENSDFDKELQVIMESSEDLSPDFSTSDEEDVDSVFKNLMENVMKEEEIVSGYNNTMSDLKGKKVLLQNKDNTLEVVVVSYDPVKRKVGIKGETGGMMSIPKNVFDNTYVGLVESKDGSSTETLTESETKVESPKENPEVKVPTHDNFNFAEAKPVEHEEFVKTSLDAKSEMNKGVDEMKSEGKKLVDVKILKHSEKFRSFVNSFKDHNPGLVECVLKAFNEYVGFVEKKSKIQ